MPQVLYSVVYRPGAGKRPIETRAFIPLVAERLVESLEAQGYPVLSLKEHAADVNLVSKSNYNGSPN
jgi:hypothetical protein